MSTGHELSSRASWKVYTPKTKDLDVLRAGEVGFMISGVKEITAAKVGDTVPDAQHPAEQPLVGFKEINPACLQAYSQLSRISTKIYATRYQAQIEWFRAILWARNFTSARLWVSLRLLRHVAYGNCAERLEREYNLDLISTAPTVIYEVEQTDGEKVFIHSPAEMPVVNKIKEIREPIIVGNILVPQDYVKCDYLVCRKTWHTKEYAIHG